MPISAGPFRGHQAARHIVPITVPKSFQSFKSQVDSQVFNWFPFISSPEVCNCQFASLVSAFRCLQISNWWFSSCRSANWWLANLLLDPTDNTFYHPPVYSLNLGPPRVPLKNHRISSLSQGPLKIRKSGPRVTKRHTNIIQILPSGHQISE